MIVDVGLKFRNLRPREITDTIVLHHAAHSNCTVEDIHKWHLDQGWAGIGYHYFIRKNGIIYRGRPEDAIGAHCFMHNMHTIGICCEGDFTKEIMTEKQFRSLCDLTFSLVRQYGASLKLHSDLVTTDCPGINFPFGNVAIFVVSRLNELLKNRGDMKWQKRY